MFTEDLKSSSCLTTIEFLTSTTTETTTKTIFSLSLTTVEISSSGPELPTSTSWTMSVISSSNTETTIIDKTSGKSLGETSFSVTNTSTNALPAETTFISTKAMTSTSTTTLTKTNTFKITTTTTISYSCQQPQVDIVSRTPIYTQPTIKKLNDLIDIVSTTYIKCSMPYQRQ
jgi:hypothetical protein